MNDSGALEELVMRYVAGASQTELMARRLHRVLHALNVVVDRDPPLDRLDALCAYCLQTRSRTPDEHGADCPWAAARRIWEEPSHGNAD